MGTPYCERLRRVMDFHSHVTDYPLLMWVAALRAGKLSLIWPTPDHFLRAASQGLAWHPFEAEYRSSQNIKSGNRQVGFDYCRSLCIVRLLLSINR